LRHLRIVFMFANTVENEMHTHVNLLIDIYVGVLCLTSNKLLTPLPVNYLMQSRCVCREIKKIENHFQNMIFELFFY